MFVASWLLLIFWICVFIYDLKTDKQAALSLFSQMRYLGFIIMAVGFILATLITKYEFQLKLLGRAGAIVGIIGMIGLVIKIAAPKR